MIFSLYVVDLLLAGYKVTGTKQMEVLFHEKYEMKDLDESGHCLGLQTF